MKIAYRCRIQEEKGTYLVTFPSLPDCLTEGYSMVEALFNAEEALTLTLGGRMAEEMSIPMPDIHVDDGEILMSPSPRVQAALLIRLTRGDITLSELARSLNSSWASVSRVEDPHHWTTLRQLSKTAATLGHKLVLSFEKYDLS